MESVNSVAVSCALEGNPRGATSTDRWTSFLQSYDSFISREVAPQHPQFARALRQLERDARLEQEQQSAQVLATLRLKDARISELQTLVSEQRDQLDVVLDELERRETKEDKEVQVGGERPKEDAAVQTLRPGRETQEGETQTEETEDESGVLKLLEKLEKELETLEGKNWRLERELQQRVLKSEESRAEHSEAMENCLDILQRGVDAMNLSCGCVDYPLAFCVGVSEEEKTVDSAAMSTCVDLEHRLEAQAVRLEHVQECLYLWRDAAVQLMKRQNEPNCAVPSTIPTISPSLIAHRGEQVGVVNCSAAFRGALAQIRQHLSRGRFNGNDQCVVKNLAQALVNGKSSAKDAAKIVQRWAGWEAKHLDEVRALRQGFAEEHAVELSRRTALLKRIDHLEQRELDLQAEVNALRKNVRVQEGKTDQDVTPLSPFMKRGKVFLGTDMHDESLEYPQLALRLATAEQSLLATYEQLAAANETIRALSSCTPAPTAPSRNGGAVNSVNQLAVELQRTSKLRLDFFQRREKQLISVGKYFQMEKSCLRMQSRLEAGQKHVAMMEATTEVCERERDELLMKVEKLETEALLANMTLKPALHSLASNPQAATTTGRSYDDSSNAFYFALTRLRLLESDNKVLRERLRHSQQQLALMKQQRPDCAQDKIVEEQTNAVKCMVEHHQNCVSEFKKLIHHQSSEEFALTKQSEGGNGTAMQTQLEWEVFLDHYEALWIAFSFLFSSLEALPQTTGVGDSLSNHNLSLEALELEIAKRDEKILLLQHWLIHQKDTESCNDPRRANAYWSTCSGEFDFGLNRDENHPGQLVFNHSREDDVQDMSVDKRVSETGRPILASTKPLESDTRGNETTIIEALDTIKTMEGPKGTTTDLEECLAKCAYLSSQNTKLTRRLRAEKETSKQCLKEQEELRTQLHARKEASSKLQHTLEECRGQASLSSNIYQSPLEDTMLPKGNGSAEHGKNTGPPRHENEHEALREQLTSREQENLTLVQSLCIIKEKCAQMEAIHQKELRVKAAEHAEGMESYMATVNETLSRIENDKRHLEEENAKLRSNLQQLEEKSARNRLEQSQRSSRGTNTESIAELFDSTAYTQENETLVARVQDLELQLSRERKLTEVVEQKKYLENQQEEQQEKKAKTDALKIKQEYEGLREWRTKLQQEFADYQGMQRTCQQESDRRIEFLSACIEEFVRRTDATVPAAGKPVSTKELYDAVMALAREPPRSADREFAVSLQHLKQGNKHLSASWGQKQSTPKQPVTTTSREDSWSNMLLDESNEKGDLDVSEEMWWKLRASKMEGYVRSAMLQNDTFEDTIRQLELGMNNVKDELSLRLAREAQLVSKLATLKSELAAAKEHAATIVDKYQAASAELEKRQGEATSRGDETQRARMAVQRKTELLSQQKAKVTSLQQELEQATKKLERLATAEKQAALLQQKAKEHTQQLHHARESYERCHDNNVQLSIHLEKLKDRYAGVVARLKASRAENGNLRTQCAELKKSANIETKERSTDGYGRDSHRSSQVELSAVSAASLTEEARTLKRRVLQKQDVIVSYKAKVAGYEAQLERQRETMLKLAHTNRELQQKQRQRQQQEQEYSSAIHAKLAADLGVKQEQLDGLRASIYDSFEAFVFCQPSLLGTHTKSPTSPFVSPESIVSDEASDDEDKLFAIKRWTDFSVQDLEELKLAGGPQRPRHKREDEGGNHNLVKQKAARAALRDVEGALEANPEDCRAEICELIQCLCY
ncbi:hypothetical protein PHYPSEUDO_009359 [Phytophthora pseudosyringae]|uniref:Uncharacterized protein n=1 Tax=Phytophthora pseudosyringae TaxID=221518 RepID=A0A8T1W947_9STRA|nr:hypothetical protein PHYPSEUDO_009359 [Phytophthora pseudosyringae]